MLGMVVKRVAALWLVFLSVPVLAAEPSTALLQQLRCTEPPDPTAPLTDLLRSGGMDAASRFGMDSTYCWRLTVPAVEAGIAFDRVCASHDDPAVIAANPEIYWRGPGTSAGIGVTFLTVAPVDAVRIALAGFGSDKMTVEPSSYEDGYTDVACTSFAFRGDTMGSIRLQPGFDLNAPAKPEF